MLNLSQDTVKLLAVLNLPIHELSLFLGILDGFARGVWSLGLPDDIIGDSP